MNLFLIVLILLLVKLLEKISSKFTINLLELNHAKQKNYYFIQELLKI